MINMKGQGRPELLVPIKNLAGLKACSPYADAVYFSCGKLNMRARADDIDLRNLVSVVKKIHDEGIKAYLTVNSVIYDRDLKTAEKVVSAARDAKVDAIITWDPAVIMLVKRAGIPLHISTQANISNQDAAKFYKDLGAERIILARELSLKQLEKIKRNVGVEVETFIHGAMCVSISGRCYLSAYLYGMSANCGACAQPCRKSWTLVDDERNEIVCDGKYLMSAKDMCMIGHIPELIRSGVDSLKIEGRLRDERYISTVSRCYKEAIDSFFEGTYTKDKVDHWKDELSKVYNRGFSTGFHLAKPTKEGFNYEDSDSLATERRKKIGVVKHYYARPGVAVVALQNSGLKVGQRITVAGKTTYIEQSAESITVDDEMVEKADKGSLIGLKLSGRARQNDVVYRIMPAKS